ncbi:general secretion pathway protein GspK [Luteimonas mephitis]|uniref:general secretion pathway protein GspK n=1 Tax=Luteimonas mephitis TaxID=83615 RepID=UPI0003F5D6F4|nr:type II secretion system protein GspK [Luteimonas mephitis]
MRRQRGIALLLVTWLTMLLAAVVGAFALTAQMEKLQGRTLSRGVVAEQAARAGVEYALTRLAESDPKQRWQPDGRPYDWAFGGAHVRIEVVDESGKVDLNAADVDLLGRLFTVLGVNQADAGAIAAAIADWRDSDDLTQPQGGAEDPAYASAGLPWGAKDAPFDTVAEVEQVLGMTPEIYAKVAPLLTVYSGQGRPDPQFAAAPVLQAMGEDPAPILARRNARAPSPEDAFLGGGSGTYSIDSRARLPNGRQAILRVVVRAGIGTVPGSTYTALRWEQGATAPR